MINTIWMHEGPAECRFWAKGLIECMNYHFASEDLQMQKYAIRNKNKHIDFQYRYTYLSRTHTSLSLSRNTIYNINFKWSASHFLPKRRFFYVKLSDMQIRLSACVVWEWVEIMSLVVEKSKNSLLKPRHLPSSSKV